jgi:adenine/guanine/hypoxanthine permease
MGVSALTTYVESAAGVAAGARTGLAAIVTGLCFVLALGVTPFVSLIPPEATAPALIIVGFLMFQTVRDIDFGTLGDGFAALLTLVLIPLTCSITNGIGVGVIVCVLLSASGGRARAVPALLWLLAAAFGLYFLLQLA